MSTKIFGGEKMYRKTKDVAKECAEKNLPKECIASRQSITDIFKAATRNVWNILKSSIQIAPIAIALLITILVAAMAASDTLATTDLIALQGTVDNGGVPLSGNLTVTIWNDSIGGTKLYDSQTDFNNAIVAGKFDVMLGSGSQTLSLDYGTLYFMDMSVNGVDLDFNGTERKMFQSSAGNISGQHIKADTITDANINSAAAISKSKISTSSTWAEADIPALSNSWVGTLNASRIVSANLLNVNSSQYCNVNNLQSLNDTSAISSLNTSINSLNSSLQSTKLNVTDQRFNETSRIDLINSSKLDITDQRFNSSSRIDLINSSKLDVTDQRFNESSMVNSVNSSLQSTKLNVTDQRFNESSAIASVNSSLNSINSSKAGIGSCPSGQVVQNTTIGGVQCTSTGGAGTVTGVTRGFGFNDSGTTISSSGTLDINASIVMLVSDQRFNDTAAISGKLDVTDQRFNSSSRIDLLNSSLQSSKLNVTDQRFNETSRIDLINSSKLDLTDQRFNESSRLDVINSTKSGTGACLAWQVIQNTTSGGVQCIDDLGAGLYSIPADVIDAGTFGLESGLDTAYIFNHNVSIGDNLSVGDNLYVNNYTYMGYSGDPAAPSAGQGVIYVKNLSGRGLTNFRGPKGADYPLQPALFQNDFMLVSTGSGVNINILGTTLTTVSATTSHVAAERYGYMVNILTAAAANSTGGTGDAVVRWYRGSISGANGFFYNTRIAFPDATYTSLRAFAGFTDGTMAASVANDAPTGNLTGFQYSTYRGDTTWKFLTRNGTAQTVADTGIPFNATGVYDMFIYCSPQCQSINWHIDDLITGNSAEGAAVNTLPTGAAAMRAGLQINNILAIARNVRFQRIYVESDR